MRGCLQKTMMDAEVPSGANMPRNKMLQIYEELQVFTLDQSKQRSVVLD